MGTAAQKRPRSVEIDLLRTLAIGMMIVHHILFDVWYLGISTIDPFTGMPYYWQKTTLILFLLLVGISFSLRSNNLSLSELYKKQIRRFGSVALAALLVSSVTLYIVPQEPVYFGVLHCIAVGILLLPLVRTITAAIIALCIVLGLYMYTQSLLPYAHNLLAPFGLYSDTFRSLDYVPLLPWLSCIILGSIIGNIVRPLITMRVTSSKVLNAALWPGKNSLLVYLVHQPIILLILYWYIH